MSEHDIAMAQAQIADLLMACDEVRAERDDARRDRDHWRQRAVNAEAILARLKTSLAENFNDPMQDGGTHGG